MSRVVGILAAMKERRWKRTSRIVCGVLGALPFVTVAMVFTGTRTVSAPELIAASLVMALVPILMLHRSPVARHSRHVAGGVLAMWPAIILETTHPHVTIEVYVASALVLLTQYRDWKVIVTSTACFLITDVLVQARFGDVDRVHALEKLFAFSLVNVLLRLASVRGNEEMEDAAARESTLEATAAVVSHKVQVRTLALQERTERYRALVENTEAMPFEYDFALDKMVYLAPQAEQLLGVSLDSLKQAGFLSTTMHADDLRRGRAAICRFIVGARSTSEPLDLRIGIRTRVVHLRVFMSSRAECRVRGVALDVTRQVMLEHELRQSHKLESVGRLAAGVAHEINTPVQFVRDSLDFVEQSIGDLVTFIRAQHARIVATPDVALDPAVEQLATEIDLDFVTAELPAAVARASDGLRRISTIVRSMNAFAHRQNAEMSIADLASSIESTLTIARAEYRHVADSVAQIDERLSVPGYVGEINQVILNLVVNASHAIADAVAAGKPRGRITVRLWRDRDSAVISVSDTGTGIPDSVKDRLFEHFYTTKPVGKGTGQGLSLARAVIVEKHHGKLTFETVLGVGTTFHVRIPLEASKPCAAKTLPAAA